MIAIMSNLLIERLSTLAARKQKLAAGEMLFRTGDRVRSLFLVADGAVRLVRPLPHGLPLTLQRAGAGTVLAEASVFAESYHCDAIAAEDSTVRVLPLRRIEDALQADHDLSRAWTRHLANEVQRARAVAEILSLKTVAERLDAWTAMHEVPPRGQWHQVAAAIGVTPEALYRELGKRRRRPVET
jgi:CRP-like cAMP-binding protein